ncbi:membrane protein insertion efficiency factor YidD [Egbenema bharatensis]|uniref:membrane protein insertion efficiency factor YidD n=1 Tax=Egbenema bharatensis TaxID=3463334 RepID=UPI003A8C4F1B
MYLTPVESLTRKTAINAIDLYQQHLSPKKGFSCPHRLLNGEASCSEYVKHLLGKQDLATTIRFSVQRFRDCASASQTLRTRRSQGGCIVIPCCIPI